MPARGVRRAAGAAWWPRARPSRQPAWAARVGLGVCCFTRRFLPCRGRHVDQRYGTRQLSCNTRLASRLRRVRTSARRAADRRAAPRRRSHRARRGPRSTTPATASRCSATRSAACSRAGCRRPPTPVLTALDDAAQVLDESLAPARPRYFAFVGSSGLEVGGAGRRPGVGLRRQPRHARRRRRPGRAPGAGLGGPVRGLSGHRRRVHERRHDLEPDGARRGARVRAARASARRASHGRPAALYCSAEAHYSVQRAAEVLGLGAAQRAVDPDRRPAPDDRRGGGGRHRRATSPPASRRSRWSRRRARR